MEQLRVAVRTMVEFTLHGEDIRPGGPLRAMQDGMLGHKARQALLGEGWQAEVPLEWTIPVEDEDLTLLLSGRMDALRMGDLPRIEEMKLWQGKHGPERVEPAHWAQAVCYGHMLCETRGIFQVEVCVAYVSRSGALRGMFEETLSAETCREQFQAVLLPYLRRLRLMRAHARARDVSLRALRFPYPAYREGQREMAAQVYTAIRLGRRLFASMPTGTGKSSAALFPALKALGEGLTGRVYYLTARTTQRQGAREALERLRRQPLHLWTLTLDAKDKQCPARTLCHPDWCPRAKGHFLRDGEAIAQMLETDDWTPETIRRVADEHQLCPFEFSLSLAELADVTVCDYNYALDPAVHIQRVFDKTSDVTLLIDEAHNLPNRVREMLSGAADGGSIRKMRAAVAKQAGRKHALYTAMTGLLRALDDLPQAPTESEGRLESLPKRLEAAVNDLVEAFLDAQFEHFDWSETGVQLNDVLSDLMGFRRAAMRGGDYAYLWQGKKQKRVTAFALDVGKYFCETTAGMRGVVCFSATLHPLAAMKRLLGGEEEDACFEMPSPFPRENLLVVQQDVNTRYAYREDAAGQIAEAVETLVHAHPGRYMVFFPSFAFLRLVSEQLRVPHQCQENAMDDAARAEFLRPYRPDGAPVCGLCVLGGVFAEGIDLPGEALDGVLIAGVGLPQVNLFQETLRDWYNKTLGDGFFYAYQLPGMQKVAQAVGRVIRTEQDRGVAVLLDDRYRQGVYRALMPPHWQVMQGDVSACLAAFWRQGKAAPMDENEKNGSIYQQGGEGRR